MIVLLLAMFAASTDAPVDARIEDVAARPAAFDGQWLRLRGQIDRCSGFGCAICPEDPATGKAQADKCLSLDWDPRRSDGLRGGELDAAYRYASVKIVARFDKACLGGADVICLDRAPVLFETRIVRTIKRRPSALGVNGRRAIDRMLEPPAKAAAPLIALMRRADGRGNEGSGLRYRVFADHSDPELKRSAIVCRSFGKDDDPATWPVDQDSALFARSSEDLFRCFFATHDKQGWLIRPD